MARDRTGGGREAPVQRTISELRVPVQDLARSVSSSVLVLGAEHCRQSLALTQILLYEGVDATMARHGLEAHDLNATRARDLIFVDCDVVALDGLEALLAGIRGSNPDLPVALLTSWPPFEPRIARAISIVEGWYVMKPIDVGELLAMIRSVTLLRRSGVANPLQRGDHSR